MLLIKLNRNKNQKKKYISKIISLKKFKNNITINFQYIENKINLNTYKPKKFNQDFIFPGKNEWLSIFNKTHEAKKLIWVEIFDSQISYILEKSHNLIKGIIVNPTYFKDPKKFKFLNNYDLEIYLKCDDLTMTEIISFLEVLKKSSICLIYNIKNFIEPKNNKYIFNKTKFFYIKKIFHSYKFKFYFLNNLYKKLSKKEQTQNFEINNILKFDTVYFPKIKKNIYNKNLEKIPLSNRSKGNTRKEDIGLFCQARITSSRLKKKALLPFYKDDTTIGYLLRRLTSYKNYIGEIVLATSNEQADDLLIPIAEKYKVKYFRGDLKNVINRMIDCADYHKWKTVVRVTGDDQFISCEYIEKCLSIHLENNYDYTKSIGLPLGLNVEIISIETLKKIKKYLVSKVDPEHITYYLDSDIICRNGIIKAQKKHSHDQFRLTLDYQEDYLLMKEIAEICHSKYGENYLTTDQIIRELVKLDPSWKHNENLWPIQRNEVNTEIQFYK